MQNDFLYHSNNALRNKLINTKNALITFQRGKNGLSSSDQNEFINKLINDLKL